MQLNLGLKRWIWQIIFSILGRCFLVGLIFLLISFFLFVEREGRRALPGEGERGGGRRRLVAALKRVSIMSVLPWIWSLLLIILGAVFIVAGRATELNGYKTMIEECREEKVFCNGLQHVAQHLARRAAMVSDRERARERERERARARERERAPDLRHTDLTD
jgi:hypothetical protein